MSHLSINSRVATVFALLLAGLLVASSPLDAGDVSDPYEKSLLFRSADSEDDDELQIVPISRLRANLSQSEVEDPLPAEQIATLVDYVNLVAERRKTHGKGCNISPVSHNRFMPPAYSRNREVVDLRLALAAQPVVLLGSIEFIIPAWDFHYETVVSVVSFRVEEVLADASEEFAAGELVTYVRQWGEATILGVDFCTTPPLHVPAESAPMIGDMLVVGGFDDLRNPNHLTIEHKRVYPVVDGLVHPPEGDATQTDRVATLEELREVFR